MGLVREDGEAVIGGGVSLWWVNDVTETDRKSAWLIRRSEAKMSKLKLQLADRTPKGHDQDVAPPFST